MHFFLIITVTTLMWTSGHCDNVRDESNDSLCTDQTACLVKELAQMRLMVQKLTQDMAEQRAEHFASQQRLHQDLESVRHQCQKESASVTHDFHKVVARADDLGPLETVVTQISQQLRALTADIQAMKNTEQLLQNANQQQDQNIQNARTSTFVHWGSSQCPSDSQLVYSGVVGGSSFDQPGGGTNYLCLTMSPVFGNHSLTGNYAYLYGTEYETQNDAHQDTDAVCAVCRASHATTTMIPGTNVCSQGWTKQYDGYLMAAHYSHNSAQFICVDSAMEGRPGTSANLNGRLLYFTLTQCGSLPCPPYENNKLVTCAVCSE